MFVALVEGLDVLTVQWKIDSKVLDRLERVSDVNRVNRPVPTSNLHLGGWIGVRGDRFTVLTERGYFLI